MKTVKGLGGGNHLAGTGDHPVGAVGKFRRNGIGVIEFSKTFQGVGSIDRDRKAAFGVGPSAGIGDQLATEIDRTEPVCPDRGGTQPVMPLP